jgi:hypothetical protein
VRHPKFVELKRQLAAYADRDSFHGMIFARTRGAVRSLVESIKACPELDFLEVCTRVRGVASVICIFVASGMLKRPHLCQGICQGPSSQELAGYARAGLHIHGARQRLDWLARHDQQGAKSGDARVPWPGVPATGGHSCR